MMKNNYRSDEELTFVGVTYQPNMRKFEFSEVSTTSSKVIFYKDAAWVVCEAIHLTCIAIAFYLLVALLHYRAIKTNNSKVSVRHRKGGEWLENLCMIGLAVALLRFANNQALLFAGLTSGYRCSVMINISIALYCLALHPVYTFLWIRQRIFYSNRALKHLYSKTVRFLSWATLICFIFLTIFTMIVFVVDSENSASGRVCRDYSLNANRSNKTAHLAVSNNRKQGFFHQQGVKVNLTAGLLAGCIQLSFLALFLYPIMDNKLRTMRTRHMRSGNNALIRLIRRSFVLAGLCILSDVAIAALLGPIHSTFPRAVFVPLALYDLNLIINLLCITMTFRRWRIMLFPWFYGNFCFLPWGETYSTLIRKTSSERYQANDIKRQHNAIPSGEPAAQDEKSHNSPVYKERRKSRRGTRRGTRREPKQNPIPDVILPALDNVAPKQDSISSKKSLSTADLGDKIHSELHHYPDAVLQMTIHSYQRTRSASLVTRTNVVLPIKQISHSALTKSLIGDSTTFWLKEGRAGLANC